ncbi:hypothetical protein [Devosia sp. SL43]|uniref:hypothetical protein n=1 Tax=Devosia sp. SL43 TaxID=2806348 RepID=UPI001F3235AC|nr:hypothetical protein [Devosia sp. SL43]UJW85130.1 hypothetical protein IM737_17240 [Devosia sp. SL43]
MANLDTHDQRDISDIKRRARTAGHVQRAQSMALAATIAAFGIVAIAAAMMTTLL